MNFSLKDVNYFKTLNLILYQLHNVIFIFFIIIFF